MASPAPYQVLARKYRPKSFAEVVGQASIVSTIENALTQKRLHHAYLFSGTRGVGKTTLARLFARALNCVNGPTTEPCSKCDPCVEIAAGSAMDVIEIDGASNRKVEDVDPLREAARYAPARDRHKIFIIDEVHMLSETAFNALLKTLEEPPPRIVFLFATTEPEQVPDTIMSRCLHLACRRVSTSDIADALRRTAEAEGAKGSREAFELIAGLAEGSMRDGLSLLDQVLAFSSGKVTEEGVREALGLIDRHLVREFVESIGKKDTPSALAVIGRLSEAGADLTHFVREALATVRDVMICKEAGSRAAVEAGASEEDAAVQEKMAELFSTDGLLRILNAMLDLADRIRRDEYPRFLLEAWAVRMIRLADLTPIEELLARLGPGGGAVTGGSGAGAVEPAGGPGGKGRSHKALRFTSVTPIATAPESAAQPPPGHAAGTGGGSVARIMDLVSRRRVSLATFLQQAPDLRMEDDTLVVTIRENQAFLKVALESADSREIVREAASSVIGRAAKLRVETESPREIDLAVLADSEEKDAPQKKRERLINEALKEPLVRTVMDMFKGQIVDIREGQ